MSLVAWAVKQARQVERAQQERGRRPADTAWHEEAERRYRAGETLRKIARDLGCSKDRVWEALQARGVEMRSPGRRQTAGKGRRKMVETKAAMRLREAMLPNVTLVPNILVNGVMSRVSGGGWKLLCYLCQLQTQGGPGASADVNELAFATGEEEADLLYDIEHLLSEGLIDHCVTVPGDRVVYWLRTGEEG